MKRALAAVLALAALGASVLPWESEARDRRCRLGRANVRTGDCVGYAFFEAFPTSGAGTSGACSTTAPTGAKGEALTFTRSSTAYCTKTASGGLATTGIADGDLVSVSNNVARQEYDSQGVLGLRVENSATNSLLNSADLTAASWVLDFSAGKTPTRTANFQTAPDGSATADRIQFAATGATEYSTVYQTWTAAASSSSACSIYLRGVSGSGSTDWCRFDGTAWTCATCNFTDASWTRCFIGGTGTAGTSRFCKLGNNTLQNGGITRAAADVVAWGAQGETQVYATSYIPTTTAAATRQAETPSFAAITGNEVVSAGSAAANAYVPWTGASGTGGLLWESATGRYLHFNGTTVRTFDGTNEPSVAHSLTAWANKRFASAWSGATFSVFNVSDGTSNTLAFDGSMTAGTALFVGYSASNGWIDGIISRVCLDPDSTRCR